MDKDLLWKQYSLYVDLYKFYMDLSIKINLFYYGITGAILSFYFSNHQAHLIRYALCFPVLMSVMFACIFFYAAHLMHVLREDLFNIRDKLGLETAPDLGVLTIVRRIFAIMFLGVAIGLGILIWASAHQITSVYA